MNQEIVNVTTTLTREEAMSVLGDMMSNASEKCYAAGWMSGCEEDIPRACRRLLTGHGGGQGMWDIINPLDAKMMCAVADALGHWVDYEGKPYVPKCDKAKS